MWSKINPLIIGVIALTLSGCAAVGYGVGGVGAARSEVKYIELEERIIALERQVRYSKYRKGSQ